MTFNTGLSVFGAFGMAVLFVVRLLVKDLGVGTSKYVYQLMT